MTEPLDPTGPTWRLWHALLAGGSTPDEARNLMNDHAHQLAEQIRAGHHTVEGHPCPGPHCIGHHAANLIDPDAHT